MRIIVVGATGTLGSAVAGALERRHEVLRAARRSALRVDLEDPSTLDALFSQVPDVDGVVCCAASGPLLPLDAATDEQFADGLRAKLLGQVALTRRAIRYLRDGGSITLTGGTFAAPLAGGSLGALVNAGIAGFVRNAAAELPRGLRINLVAPGWIRETLVAMGEDGAAGTPAAEVARAYVSLVEGKESGKVVVPNSELAV
jgi:NAD(P)-dependent dehydrogenase (short-subunit alcohol dehydrogenase family)